MKIALVATLAAAVVNAHVHVGEEGSRTCGTDHNEEQIKAAIAIADETVAQVCNTPGLESLRVCQPAAARLAQPIEIPVVYHIIHAGARGNLTDAEVQAQFDQTQKDFAGEEPEGGEGWGRGYPMDITFRLHAVTRTDNPTWFSNGQQYESQFKNQLAREYPNTNYFNQYFTDFSAGLLGFCYFPNSFQESSNLHGCVNLYSSVPGGSSSPYNEGKTTTHETGHGIGLYHTFQNGCFGHLDEFQDTCPQSFSTSGCPATGPNSCPFDDCDAGDPIHNYMDYSTDACMNQFTEGQNRRANNQLFTYRPSLYNSKEEMDLINRFAPNAFAKARTHARKSEERITREMAERIIASKE